MKNVIILGSGRSGTSMVAGILAKSGYFMGEHLLPANDSNPKGFFEDIEVNSINESILESVAPKRPRIFGNIFFRHIPLRYQRWLLTLPEDKSPRTTPAIEQRMKNLLKNRPFCLKDPRFSYTLPCWIPFLENTVFVVVFREPMATAKSINKECQSDPELRSLAMDENRALVLWECMYKHILKTSNSSEGKWLFLHYEQAFTKTGIDLLTEHTGARTDFSFPDKKLNRTMTSGSAPQSIMKLYSRLCEKAGFDSAFN